MLVSGYKLQTHSTQLRKRIAIFLGEMQLFCLLSVAPVEDLEPAVLVQCVYPFSKTIQFAFAFRILHSSCISLEQRFCGDVLCLLSQSPTYVVGGGGKLSPFLRTSPIFDADQACIVMGEWRRVIRSC